MELHMERLTNEFPNSKTTQEKLKTKLEIQKKLVVDVSKYCTKNQNFMIVVVFSPKTKN